LQILPDDTRGKAAPERSFYCSTSHFAALAEADEMATVGMKLRMMQSSSRETNAIGGTRRDAPPLPR
jgi:hypothetical protein